MNRKIQAVLATAALGLTVGGVASAATPNTLGTTVSISGDTYNPVTPIRVYDSRTAGVMLAANTKQSITFTAAQVPDGATAVVLTVTAASETAPNGDLDVVPGDSVFTPGSTSNVNFTQGVSIADQVTVMLGAGKKIDIYNHSAGTVRLIVDLAGYYAVPAATAITTYTPTSFTQVTALGDHPDSDNSGGNWAVDTLTRTATITYQSAAAVSHCGAGATSCYLYEGVIQDSGTFTTKSSADVTTDGKTPNAGTAMNGVVSGTVTGSSAVEFYATQRATGAQKPAASVSGAVSGEQTTTNWVEQFFPAGTAFGTGPDLLNWNWTYTATTPNTCETWVDAYNGESGDITGVNHCAS